MLGCLGKLTRYGLQHRNSYACFFANAIVSEYPASPCRTTRGFSRRGDFAIRTHDLTQWAFPQPQVPSPRQKLAKVHGRPVPFTSDPWPRFWLGPISVPIVGGYEVSPCAVVVDQAIALRTGKSNPVNKPSFGRRENLVRVHLDVMFVAQRLKSIPHLCGWHNVPPPRRRGSPPPTRFPRLGNDRSTQEVCPKWDKFQADKAKAVQATSC